MPVKFPATFRGGALLAALREITPKDALRVVGMGGDNLAPRRSGKSCCAWKSFPSWALWKC